MLGVTAARSSLPSWSGCTLAQRQIADHPRKRAFVWPTRRGSMCAASWSAVARGDRRELRVRGRVELGDAVEIGPNCVLKDVRVDTGARIAAFSHLESAAVGPTASSAPMPGCVPALRSARGGLSSAASSR